MFHSRLNKIIKAAFVLSTLTVGLSCQKDEIPTPQEEISELVDFPLLPALPVPLDGDFSAENPATYEDLQKAEEARLANESVMSENGVSRGFSNGVFSFDQKLNISSNFGGLVFINNSYLKVEIVSGGISFVPKFHFDSYIAGSKIQSAQAFIQNTVTGDAVYKATVKKTLSKGYNVKLKSWNKTAFTLLGGVVPVWITFDLQLDAGIIAKAETSCSVKQGITATSSVKIGAKWTKNAGWKNISSIPKPTFTATYPIITYSKTVILQPSITAFLTAKLYGFLGPRLSVSPYLKITASLDKNKYLYMDRVAGLRGDIYFSLAGLGLKSPVYDKNVFNLTRTFNRIYL